jgi:hypothetical protein
MVYYEQKLKAMAINHHFVSDHSEKEMYQTIFNILTQMSFEVSNLFHGRSSIGLYIHSQKIMIIIVWGAICNRIEGQQTTYQHAPYLLVSVWRCFRHEVVITCILFTAGNRMNTIRCSNKALDNESSENTK